MQVLLTHCFLYSEALNNLNDFISCLQRKENELMQDLHPDIAISLSETNSSCGDTPYFIREGDQILLSVAATRKISTLVRRANKHNQLPNVEGEDLGWMLKKLEKNVRMGWMSIQAENHSSQEQFHFRHMDDLDVPTLEHAINCTLSVFSILTSTKLDKKVGNNAWYRISSFDKTTQKKKYSNLRCL
jgi:hypothetical protein